MKILVVGAGAWGTALAVAASHRHTVTLLARDSVHASAMARDQVNKKYLPSVPLPESLVVQAGDLVRASSDAQLVVIATPMAGLREQLARLSDAKAQAPVAWLCKGFEKPVQAESAGLLGHELARTLAPDLRTGVLSGPSFAQEVAKGLPTALVAASPDATVVQTLVNAFHTDALRLYGSDDWVGVEVGGAVKNVLAIATGLCDGLTLGLNARAALITRGLAEMARLGVWDGAWQSCPATTSRGAVSLQSGEAVLAGWRESPAHGLAFLGGFYATIVGGLAAIVLVFGLAARFGAGIKRHMLGVSALALLVFGMYQLSKAFS